MRGHLCLALVALSRSARCEHCAELSYASERHALAKAYRTLAVHRLSAASGLGNHLTLSVPPSHDRFLVIRYGLHWMEVTAANLVLVHVNGTILEGEGPVQGAAVSLHAPMHRGYGRSARVIFHTHQPWSTALACVEDGGLAMYHPDAAMYYHEAGFDEVYTGNWPVGSRQGTVDEGTRLLHSPALRGKRVGFLANHGTLLLSETIEEAVFDAVHLERLAWQQVHAMQYGRLPRLGHEQVQSYRDRYMGEWQLSKWQHGRTLVESAAARVALAPIWNGTGTIPDSAELCPGDEEATARCQVALACRLFGRLNGHRQFEGISAHFSAKLSDGTVLVVPSDVPFESMRPEWLSQCSSSAPHACTGPHTVNYKALERFSRVRTSRYPVVLYMHTKFTDEMAHRKDRLRMIHQSAFNFALPGTMRRTSWSGDIDADPGETEEYVVNMYPFGGCLFRGSDVAHVFAVVQNLDSAAEIQTRARKTRSPLLELDSSTVMAFPPHGYGDLTVKTKRMELNFAANARMLLAGWNQGFADGDTGE